MPAAGAAQNSGTLSSSPSPIATSNNCKAKETELFRLSQYVDAEKAFASALDGLPANHMPLVLLHINRAVTRLKTGDHVEAFEGCTAVLASIGTAYHATRVEEDASV